MQLHWYLRNDFKSQVWWVKLTNIEQGGSFNPLMLRIKLNHLRSGRVELIDVLKTPIILKNSLSQNCYLISIICLELIFFCFSLHFLVGHSSGTSFCLSPIDKWEVLLNFSVFFFNIFFTRPGLCCFHLVFRGFLDFRGKPFNDDDIIQGN